MESPNPVIDPTAPGGGVAMLPMSADHIRSLISDSQGPRPLSNVFAYHGPRETSRMRSRGNVRTPPAPRPQRAHVFASLASSREAETDERKRPAEDPPIEQSSSDDDMPPLQDRRQFDSSNDSDMMVPSVSISVSATLSATAAVHPTPPTTRSSRKRRAEEMREPAAKRSAVASADGKPAGNLKADPEDDFSDAGSCCICMCDPDDGELATIDGCDHEFCFNCIEKWSERENTCPLCKVRFQRINREGDKRKGQKGTKKVKQRDQRADLNPGNALEGLLAGLNANQGFSSSIARLIFSGLGPSNGGVIDFGMGAANAGAPGAAMRRAGPAGVRQVRWRNPPTHIEDALFSDNEDGSDDEQPGYSDFVTTMRRMQQHRSGGSAVFGAYPNMMAVPPRGQRTGRVAAFHAAMAAAAPPARYTRSYATNAHEPNAGGTAANALEIEDDSDDDEVEVVDVRQRDV
eukprot:CAMPEP_0119004258 /NCGR_PEP_ID=MMETSP1176-20130426/1042_1 /TAXON_ID=265551 /ORGANISM="Synedropsis recta cf, Strain CCMP1620" /LENGTH=460 /DNA_ID=CAMNT_0006955943 /DNA_START=661 /DNA_END=2043 /DNA_ORIENTATION=+